MSQNMMSLPKETVLERVQAMMFQEERGYRYESYFPSNLSPEELERQSQLNVSWREKICQWSYNVVDHFDLPREVVAISLDLFDRYLATRGNQCSGNMALLASLTTLHIAIKVHSEKNVKVATLASLSRGQFGARHIEQMEWQVFSALRWKLHPPTLFAYISHLLLLFSPEVHHAVRKELFEVAIYMAELSVCDSFFVRLPSSVVAIAAILNVMDDMSYHRLPLRAREAFWKDVATHLGGFHAQASQVRAARERLKAMFATTNNASSTSNTNTSTITANASAASQAAAENASVTTSPTSTTDAMQVDESGSIASSCNSYFRSRTGSACGEGHKPYRYSPAPNVRRGATSIVVISASPMGRSRIASSPIVAGLQ